MPEVLRVQCTGKGAGEGACAREGGGEGGAEGAGEHSTIGVCMATGGTTIEGTSSRNS
jgi:hypothetical protein